MSVILDENQLSSPTFPNITHCISSSIGTISSLETIVEDNDEDSCTEKKSEKKKKFSDFETLKPHRHSKKHYSNCFGNFFSFMGNIFNK